MRCGRMTGTSTPLGLAKIDRCLRIHVGTCMRFVFNEHHGPLPWCLKFGGLALFAVREENAHTRV